MPVSLHLSLVLRAVQLVGCDLRGVNLRELSRVGLNVSHG